MRLVEFESSGEPHLSVWVNPDKVCLVETSAGRSKITYLEFANRGDFCVKGEPSWVVGRLLGGDASERLP